MSVFSVTRTTYADDVRAAVQDLNRKSIEVFRSQNGFKSIQEYSSRDRNEIMLIIEWEDESCHRACQMNPQWGALLPKWNELMAAEKMALEVGLYQNMGQAN